MDANYSFPAVSEPVTTIYPHHVNSVTRTVCLHSHLPQTFNSGSRSLEELKLFTCKSILRERSGGGLGAFWNALGVPLVELATYSTVPAARGPIPFSATVLAPALEALAGAAAGVALEMKQGGDGDVGGRAG